MPRFAPYGFIRGQINIACNFPAGTALVESLTDFLPGFGFVVEKVSIAVDTAGGGAGASRAFRVTKNASTEVATTTYVLADSATVGAVKNCTLGTEENRTFRDTDTLSIEWLAAGAVAFTGGRFNVIVQFRQRPQRQAD